MWINEDKLIILNDFDRPCMHLVCRVLPSGKVIYGSIKLRRKYPKLRRGKGKSTLKDFGFIYDIFKHKYRLVNPSVATYEDGKPRKWQGKTEFTYEEVVKSTIFGD